MGQITRYQGSEKVIQQELARQISNTQMITAIGRIGIAQIGYTHRYAQFMVAHTLQTAHIMLQTADATHRLTPEQETMVQQLIHAYCNQMLVLADQAGAEMISVFHHQNDSTRR